MSGANAVVCNTGPLIALGLLGRLNLLQTFHQRVVIPETVQREILQGGTMRPGMVDLSVEWIEVLPAMPDPVLAAMLDPGEAAVLVLARSLGISHVLMDERKGRKIAPRSSCLIARTGRAFPDFDGSGPGAVNPASSSDREFVRG